MAATFSTSAGHVLSGAEWLDAHFSACRAEYAELLDLVPFGPGARLLDAVTDKLIVANPSYLDGIEVWSGT